MNPVDANGVQPASLSEVKSILDFNGLLPRRFWRLWSPCSYKMGVPSEEAMTMVFAQREGTEEIDIYFSYPHVDFEETNRKITLNKPPSEITLLGLGCTNSDGKDHICIHTRLPLMIGRKVYEALYEMGWRRQHEWDTKEGMMGRLFGYLKMGSKEIVRDAAHGYLVDVFNQRTVDRPWQDEKVRRSWMALPPNFTRTHLPTIFPRTTDG